MDAIERVRDVGAGPVQAVVGGHGGRGGARGGSLVEGEEGDGGNSDFNATALSIGVPAGGSSLKVGSNGGGNDFDAVALLGLQFCFDLVALGD